MAVFAFFGEFGMGQKSEGTSTVLDADDDHATLGEVFPQVAAIVLGLEAATVNPYHDGQTVVDALCGCGDAEVEAVLAHHVGRTALTCGLWGPGTVVVSLQHTFPGLSRLWGTPTQVTNRRCCVRNGFIHGKLTIEDAL